MVFLSAYSNCDIPLGQYQSSGGLESYTELRLTKTKFVLINEIWQPGQYEDPYQVIERGAWSCIGAGLYIDTKAARVKAQLSIIVSNPLGYPEVTKPLVFESSNNEVLSKKYCIRRV